jgi:hypothetical protein
MQTQTYDFSRSFMNFEMDLEKQPAVTLSHRPPTRQNVARIQVECCCEMTALTSGQKSTYVLGASCKTERVGAESDLWILPNADFKPVFSETEFLIFKSWSHNQPGVKRFPPTLGDQPERQVGVRADAFASSNVALKEVEGEVLESVSAMDEAQTGNRPIVACTEYEENGYRMVIHHPVYTFNVGRREGVYQTDTGPILVPNISAERLINGQFTIGAFDLAFAAFNCDNWAEFVINVPTPISDTVSVNRYSKVRRIEGTRNALIAL